MTGAPAAALDVCSWARSSELTAHLGEPTSADSLLLVQSADPGPSETAVLARGEMLWL